MLQIGTPTIGCDKQKNVPKRANGKIPPHLATLTSWRPTSGTCWGICNLCSADSWYPRCHLHIGRCLHIRCGWQLERLQMVMISL